MNSFVSTEFVLKNEVLEICNRLQPESIEQFWLAKLVSGKLMHAYWDTNIGKEDLYQSYKDFCNVRQFDIKSFSDFDQLIFGNLLLDHSDSDNDYRPSTGRRKKEEPEKKLAHCVPELERSRRLYLEARPDLVSHITRMRFEPIFSKHARFIRLDFLLLLSGIAILSYQAILLSTEGTWTSFSILHFMELANWQTGLSWFADTSNLSTTKILSQKLLSYAEIALIFLMLGALVYINTDHD